MLLTGYATQRPPFKRRKIFILLVVALLALFLRNNEALQQFGAALNVYFFQSAQTALYAPLRGVQSLWQQFQQNDSRDQRLHQLETENRILRAQNEILGDLKAENRRLHMLMDSVQNVRVPVSVAALKDADIDGIHENVLIGRGQEEGVYLGQPVIDPYGLVGQVSALYPHSAKVMLISDARSRVPVYITRNGDRALVAGTSDIGGLTLPNLPLNTDVREGDVLMSSGFGNIFPRGYPVAVVEKVVRDQKRAFLQIKLKPFAHLSSLLEVLLLDHPSSVGSVHLPIGPQLPSPEKAP